MRDMAGHLRQPLGRETRQVRAPGRTSGARRAHTPRAVVDFSSINRLALPALVALLARWLPGGRREADEYVVRNPTRRDRQPGSFKINLKGGARADFATGDKGGDPISLAAYLFDLRQAIGRAPGHGVGAPVPGGPRLGQAAAAGSLQGSASASLARLSRPKQRRLADRPLARLREHQGADRANDRLVVRGDADDGRPAA
jgi:hypothetical protein